MESSNTRDNTFRPPPTEFVPSLLYTFMEIRHSDVLRCYKMLTSVCMHVTQWNRRKHTVTQNAFTTPRP
jgi:hypothetical protein